ncbi:hypothetical protein D3C87_976620 [compost metagenome]
MKKQKELTGIGNARTFTAAVRLVNYEKVEKFIEENAEMLKSKTYKSPYYKGAQFKFKATIHQAVKIIDFIDEVEKEAKDKGYTFE